jgi:arabinosaccharide transport system substrate-binding protein
MEFPYGKAPLAILLVALVSGATLLGLSSAPEETRPDLVFTLFAENHLDAYRRAVREFEKIHGVTVRMQLLDGRALRTRVQAAIQVGADVPDLVEIPTDAMGNFTRGPVELIGLVDLTDRLRAEGLLDRLVESRFSLWSSRGRIFALPHDVHPVMLCYRRDLVEELGIDVDQLDTWEEFVEMGRRVTADLDGDGLPDRYAIDLPSNGAGMLELLMRQKGEGVFDANGQVAFDTPGVAELILWYIRQTRGEERIGFPAGWGQTLSQTMIDGLVLFYFAPDWRTKQFTMNVPKLEGKLALMPLPAWEPGGRRTSSWGGTGLAITKACPRQDLAWKLAKHLYLKPEALGQRFLDSYIIPPLKDAWELEAFEQPNPFFSDQPIGKLFAELAPSAPPDHSSPYRTLAGNKLQEAFLNAAARYDARGEEGLRKYTLAELTRCAGYVRRVMARNRFFQEPSQ